VTLSANGYGDAKDEDDAKDKDEDDGEEETLGI